MTVTVLFCDLCNESVPQPDLQDGRASLINGRVVCATCERLMSPPAEPSAGSAAQAVAAPRAFPYSPEAQAPAAAAAAAAPGGAGLGALDGSAAERPVHHAAPARRPRSSAGGAGLAALAVLVAIAIGWKLDGRIDDMATRYDEALRASVLEYRQAALRNSRGAREQADRINESFDGFADAMADFEQRLDRAARLWADESEQMMAELRDFDLELSRMGEMTARIGRHDKEMLDLQQKFARTLDDLSQHDGRLQELEERPPVSIVDPGAVAGAGGGATPVAQGGEQPQWAHLLAGLSSPNADERWLAVDELGQTGDAATADYLVPMLKDEDTFVRMATARILGELEAAVGIPALIDALEDEEPAVREAAMVALQSSTGRELGFDPHGSPADRAKRVKAWRQWWEKARDDYLGA